MSDILNKVSSVRASAVLSEEISWAEIVSSLLDFAEGPAPKQAKKRVRAQLAPLFDNLDELAQVNPAALTQTDSILQLASGSSSGNAPALTGGSTAPAIGADDIVLTGTAAAKLRSLMGANRTPESMIDLIFDVLGPLASLDPGTQAARLAVISDVVADKPGRKVDVSTGKLESEEKVDGLQTQLSNVQAAHQPFKDVLDTLNASDKRLRTKGAISVLDGTVPVDASSGQVLTHYTGVPQADHDDVVNQLDATRAAIGDLKAHTKPSRLTGKYALDLDDCSDPTHEVWKNA